MFLPIHLSSIMQSHGQLCSKPSDVASTHSAPIIRKLSRSWRNTLLILSYMDPLSSHQAITIPKSQLPTPRNTFYLEPTVATHIRIPEYFFYLPGTYNGHTYQNPRIMFLIRWQILHYSKNQRGKQQTRNKMPIQQWQDQIPAPVITIFPIPDAYMPE